LPSVRDLARAAARGPLLVTGATAPYAAYLATALAAARPLVVVVPSDAAARTFVDDLALFGGAATVLPEPDGAAYAELAADRAADAARLAVLFALTRGDAAAPRTIVLSGPALIKKTLPPAELAARTVELAKGQAVDRDATATRLLECGFARAPVVDDTGTFAVRGAVIDVGAPGLPYPARIELFGDEIESIRLFDPATQRTLREVERLALFPIRTAVPSSTHDWKAAIRALADDCQHPSSATRRLIEQLATGDAIGVDVYAPAFHAALAPVAAYLPADATWLWWDPDATLAAIDGELAAADAGYAERRAHKQLAFPPAAHYVDRAAVVAQLASQPRRVVLPALTMIDDPRGAGAEVIAVAIDPLARLRTELERARVQHDDHLGDPLTRAIALARADGTATVVIAADSAQRADRLHGLLEGHGLAADRVERLGVADAVQLMVAPLSQSFASAADGLLAIAAGDVFGKKHHGPRQKSASKRAKDALLGGVGDFAQLAPGDFLVHVDHGIGIYRGLKELAAGGTKSELLAIEYLGGDKLFLPVDRLASIQRYGASDGVQPRIDKLGGETWQKTKGKVKASLRDMAGELLSLHAARELAPGFGFSGRDAALEEFEAAFAYEETPDQMAAIDDVLGDMQEAKPMDRLVCGDVGYGKTEVAIRAAFRAAQDGKQVVVLTPTTVLCQQHFENFQKRFAPYPIRVDQLSRFCSPKDSKATLEGLATGQVDVVVATHRILQKNVAFKDLGLLVVDEEQRFGVAHKERIKKLKKTVDVLTLTATPIPRTLQMAFTGIRDLSVIETPPVDRLAIRTQVCRFDEGLIREAILREMRRGGQVFFLHNRVRSIEAMQETLSRAVPEARIMVAHGQMKEHQLEDRIHAFLRQEADVLLCTTIIESGIDMPNVNTILVHRADALGLAQLYQLRGRVGRSPRRAYAYLLVPTQVGSLSADAQKRLEAIQDLSELGAGFRLANLDLEIRGAGDLLGAEQSGNLRSVGYETYMEMLEQTIDELRGQAHEDWIDPEIKLPVVGRLPDDYVADVSQRLVLYKRLSAIEDEDECRALLDEIADRFGPVPGETILLADLMIVKALARRLDATAIELTRTRLAIALGPSTPVDPTKLPKGWRLDRDGRLHAVWGAEDGKSPTAAARTRLQALGARAT
jgi:transcription-repair coupling factor (superfamily II helicase)